MTSTTDDLNAPATAKRRRLTPEARREEILETATRLISERGYNGVTLQEVADACGMAKSGVLHHFPSKDNLLVELLRYRDERDLSADEIELLPESTPESARLLIDRIVHRNFDRREIVRLFSVLAAESLDPGHPAHTYFAQRLVTARDTILKAASLIHPEPESATLRMIAFMDGLQILWLRDESVPVLKLWADFADHLFAE